MNILFIQTDQQRRDSLPCYGNQIAQTPHIDRLAAEGTVFENAFTPTPICAPARGSLLTGRLPSRHGILRNPESGSPAGYDFKEEYPTYAQQLAEQGYACSHIGKWHIGSSLTAEDCGLRGIHYPGYGYPERHPHYLEYLKSLGLDGFELEDEVYGTHKDGSQGSLLSAVQKGGEQASVPYYLTQQTIEAITKAADSDAPFFVSCNFWGPHVPYIIPQEYMDMYSADQFPEPQSWSDDLSGKPSVQKRMKDYWSVQDLAWQDWAALNAACLGYVSLIDAQVGRLVQTLEELGLADSTAIVFSTDHGGMVGRHGLCDKGPYLYDDICRIPLIIKTPGQKPSSNSSPVYNMDLMPTFIEMGGGQVPEDLDSCSLLPLVTGQAEQVREEPVYMEFYGHQVPVTQKVLRTAEWKYIFNGQTEDEFYDLINDPHEMHNLINDASSQEAIQQACTLMHTRLSQQKDPILRYFVRTRMKG